MIAIIDYDAGNLKSVEKALLSLGQQVVVTRDCEELLRAEKVILPGESHGSYIVHSEKLAKIILDFLDRKRGEKVLNETFLFRYGKFSS